MKEVFDILDKNGVFVNKVETRDICHKEGFWHRAVIVAIINSNHQVLLQKRSATKKMWPNLWDITAGGHVLAGEFGFETVIRETKEEIGVNLEEKDLLFIGSTTSTNINGDRIDNHFNEYFVATKEVDTNTLSLQKEEVQDIKWFDKEEVISRIHNNYDGLTDKIGCWEFLERYLNYIK